MTSGTSYSPPPAFGSFTLLHQIGAGVLGPVFRTQDPEGDRLVAVKAFNLDITPEQAAELAAEFQHLVDLCLEHPHLAVPVGTGIENFVAYLASQYVTGESLDAAIRQYGPAPAGDASRLMTHIAGALDAAARVGVFHGALHPRDILVTPGETHVTGLGVAKALERIGLHGPIRRPYVAPERESGEEWGAAADVYSLAAISYEVLTGRRALPGTEHPLPGLGELPAHDVTALREIIEAALDPDPDRRPAHAAEFASVFTHALLADGVAPAPGERPARTRKPRVRTPKLPGLDDPLTAVADQAFEAAPAPVVPDEPAPFLPKTPEVQADAPAGGLAERPGPPVRELTYEPVEEPVDEPLADTLADTLADVEVRPVDLSPAEPGIRSSEPLPETAPLPPAMPQHAAPIQPPAPAAKPTPDARVRIRRRGLAPRPLAADVPLAADAPIAADAPAQAVPLDDDAASLVAALELPRDQGGEADTGDPALLSLELPASDEESAAGKTGEHSGRTEDVSISFAPEARELGGGGFTPELEGLAEALATPLATPAPRPRSRTAEAEVPADEWREPGALVSEPSVPRAIDLLSAHASSRSSRALDPEPYRSAAPVWRPRAPLAVGVGIGVLAGLIVAYLWWAGTSRPESILPPGTVAEVSPAPTPTPEPRPAAPPPAAPAAPAATAAAGDIRVVTTPAAAEVFVDGARRGVTPKNLSGLPFGTYTIRVTRKGYTPQEREVVLDAQHPNARLSVPLVRAKGSATPSPAPGTAARGTAPAAPTAVISVASVSVETLPPGARVRLDGKDVGVSPITISPVTAGPHLVEFILPGYKAWSRMVTVVARQRAKVTGSLERDTPR